MDNRKTTLQHPCSGTPVPVILVLLAFTLGGCASTLSQHELEPAQYLHDEAFPRAAVYWVESRREVFSLDRDAKRYMDRNITSQREFHDRGRALLDEIFHQAALNLSYQSNANTTASQTFHNQSANCLSMSILAYAMAEYAGFDATFQEVDIPEFWERRNNFSLMNRHINLKLSPAITTGTMLVKRSITFEVDFQPLDGTSRFNNRTISQSRVLAMFYNNKGIDALLENDHDTAYAYMKAAVLTDPELDMALTNLGLLYRLNNHPQWAEKVYRQAIRLNDENSIAIENLAMLLKQSGRTAEAETLLARLERQRKNNPWFLYIMGEEAFDAGQLQDAIRYFRKAIAIEPDADEFHFGMAKSFLRLGDSESAELWLRRAERNADYPDLKRKYQGKISALSRL